MAQTVTVISCGSPGDAARLASLLSRPAQWAGMVAPDLIEASSGQVILTWRSAPGVTPASSSAAVRTASGSALFGPVTISHTASGTTTVTKQ